VEWSVNIGSTCAREKLERLTPHAEDVGAWLLRYAHTMLRDVDYFTSRLKLSEWLLNSGAYMHWIVAMPV
jgi:hypothetical protein